MALSCLAGGVDQDRGRVEDRINIQGEAVVGGGEGFEVEVLVVGLDPCPRMGVQGVC